MVNKIQKFFLLVPIMIFTILFAISLPSVSATSFVYHNDTFSYVIPSYWNASPAGSLSSGKYTITSLTNNNYMNYTILMPPGYSGNVNLTIDIAVTEQRANANTITLTVNIINSTGTYELWTETQVFGAGHTYTFDPPDTYSFPYDPTLCVFQIYFYYQYTPNVVSFTVDDCITYFDGNPIVIEDSLFTSTTDGWYGGSISSGIYKTPTVSTTTCTITKQLPLTGVLPSGQNYLIVCLQVISSGTYGGSRDWDTTVNIVNSTGTYKVYNHTFSGGTFSADDYVSFWVYYDPVGTNVTITQTVNSATLQSVGVDNFHYAVPLLYGYNVTAIDEDQFTAFLVSNTTGWVASVISGTITYYPVPTSAFVSSGLGWFILLTPYEAESLIFRVANTSASTQFYERHIFTNAPIENVTFILTNKINQVITVSFTLYDLTNYWVSSSNITARATRSFGGVTYTIDEGQIDITQSVAFSLIYGQQYYLTLYNPVTVYSYVYGLFYSTTSSVVLVLSQSPMAGTSPSDICTWNVTNAGNLLNITADFGGAVNPEIKIYNESLLLEATYSFTSVESVTISYSGNSSKSYSVKLTIADYGWVESRIASANPSTGYILNLPLLGVVDPSTLVLSFITAISFIWTPKYKGIGAVITVGMAALFIYFRWLVIPVVIITLWFLMAIIYAVTRHEGED